MFKKIAGVVGPAQKSSEKIIEINYSCCHDVNYLDAVNRMHQVKLKAPQPQPPLKEAATDSIFQAFEYLKRIEAIIQQNAKSTEEALVINLNRFFVQEFEDIKPMKLSETVQKAKEHWKQGTSDGNAQHHLFPKLQIAKLA